MQTGTNSTQVKPGLVGIWSIELRNCEPAARREMAAELDELGWGALWIPGLSGTDTMEIAEALLDATSRAVVATGVVSIWSHLPEELGATHRRLQERYGGRLLLGLGASNAGSAERAGHVFRGAVTEMNAFLDRLDAVPAGERVLAALGPRMTALAASRSAGSHPFLVSPEYTRRTRVAVGSGPLLAPHQAVVLQRDANLARTAARAAVGMYIGFPSYQKNLRRLGFADEDFVPGGSDRLIDRLVAWGDLDVIRQRIDEHHDAGADHVALHVLASEGGPTVRQSWRELATLNF